MTRARPPRTAAPVLLWALLLAAAAAPGGAWAVDGGSAAEAPAEAVQEEGDEGAPEDAEGEGGEEPQPEEPAGPRLPRRLERFVPEEERVETTVTVVCDAPCRITVDGEWKGEIEGDEPLEITVKTGSRSFRAFSREAPSAEWSRVVEVAESASRTVRVRLRRAIRELRRKERQEGTFLDERTGLQWPRRDGARDMTWEQSRRFCEDSGYAGFADWRLPTLEELESLHNLWSQATYKIVGGIVLTACCVWSSDHGDDSGWNFNYQFRKPFRGLLTYSLGLRALCVREAGEEPAAESESESVAASGDG